MTIAYLGRDSLRQLKNARAIVFTVAVPLIMLIAFGGSYGGSGQVDASTHLPWVVVTTIQVAAYGGMMAALSQAFQIVTERSIGWNRQLRITPLSGTGYLVSKVVAALALALFSILLIIVASLVLFHPDLAAGSWVLAGLAVWCGVVPFALLGIVIGQFAKPEFAQPLFMVVFMGMAILGGLWIPLQIFPAWVADVAKAVPSYWLNRVGQLGALQSGDALTPAIVLALWTLALAALVVWRYRRDAARG
ncbi:MULTISPECIES: ABC transporter permease [unclassified Leifsonia]|uniref:ABC transporter permease n=1 Tax=unclassified Leifsonia TaxID=2663824 RepID=UPI0008A7E8FD|nr:MULTISPECIES: ABC transporter permease [unclassified Leifsonia]SEI11983.1 ABC-2 type transport system permease protein [Leifsonia sp. CL154]SFL94458.1 ABC-2 type transport system permease protein [Leifsonia sp. CL147]